MRGRTLWILAADVSTAGAEGISTAIIVSSSTSGLRALFLSEG